MEMAMQQPAVVICERYVAKDWLPLEMPCWILC